MPYTRSVYRVEFDSRLAFLRKKAKRAARLRASDQDIRDLVLQCTILHTSAALETYLKLLVEKWVQNVRALSIGNQISLTTRSYIASRRLQNMFNKFLYIGDEKGLIGSISSEADLWAFMQGNPVLPGYFHHTELLDGTSYPSYRNIARLFVRLGVPDIHGQLGRALRRDPETMIENFQSLRTALAHSAPPSVTIIDVENRLADMKALVSGIDRVFHRHVVASCGAVCWA